MNVFFQLPFVAGTFSLLSSPTAAMTSAARKKLNENGFELERRTSRRDVQHPTAPFPLAAKPLEGEGVAAKCLRSRPELRRMGVKNKEPASCDAGST